MLANRLYQLVDGGGILEGDDFDQGDHRLVYTRVAEAEDPSNHASLVHP
jgi:hypothetical protein